MHLTLWAPEPENEEHWRIISGHSETWLFPIFRFQLGAPLSRPVYSECTVARQTDQNARIGLEGLIGLLTTLCSSSQQQQLRRQHRNWPSLLNPIIPLIHVNPTLNKIDQKKHLVPNLLSLITKKGA